MRLEQEITNGGVIYITSIERNFDSCSLVFNFLKDPESSAICRILTFSGVEEFSEVWDEEFDKDLIEQLIGIVEIPQANGIKYFIRLYQFEISFRSSLPPQIQFL